MIAAIAVKTDLPLDSRRPTCDEGGFGLTSWAMELGAWVDKKTKYVGEDTWGGVTVSLKLAVLLLAREISCAGNRRSVPRDNWVWAEKYV